MNNEKNIWQDVKDAHGRQIRVDVARHLGSLEGNVTSIEFQEREFIDSTNITVEFEWGSITSFISVKKIMVPFGAETEPKGGSR